jgi:IMP dehydrogenase/GMP reductase
MKKMLTFDDVLIVPKFSSISSRKEVDISSTTSGGCFEDIGADFPVISANMDTVTGPDMARAMLTYGGQACLHRFCSIEENVKMFAASEIDMVNGVPIYGGEYYIRPMVSIGLGKEELDRASALYGNNATRFIIDVAHGAQQAVVDQVRNLRDIIGSYGSIIVGNFASKQSVADFLQRVSGKVDGIKVGIGPGSACTTRIKTGVGFPQFSAIQEISFLLRPLGIPLIADGGMRTPGDICKALGAGASMVMLGGMLAGADETPGELLYVDSLGEAVKAENFLARKIFLDGTFELIRDEYSESFKKVKKYRGSASKESYDLQGKVGDHRTSEGESFLVSHKGPVKSILQDIEGGLRSAMTYVGARTLKEFHDKVEFIRVSSSTNLENKAHGDN